MSSTSMPFKVRFWLDKSEILAHEVATEKCLVLSLSLQRSLDIGSSPDSVYENHSILLI